MSAAESREALWPSLPLEAWSDTCATLHMWLQIVGKIRLTQTTWTNHSWHVTLYVTSTACEPCNSGRQMLKQRGIPFNERLVVTAEDSEALEKLSGAREAPTLAVGSQIARGYAAEIWGSYLDAAGYPRESRLPSTYQYRAAAPVVDRRAQATPGAEARAETRNLPTAPAAAPPPAGIRF